MVVTATLAVSWPMFLGIGHSTIYRANTQSEKYDREQALIWDASEDASF
jgi:hypothetical protein